jgi:serine/threonine protein phosphatase PrpC
VILLAERKSRVELLLLIGADMDAPAVLPFAGGRVAALSYRAPGAEGPNEDAALVLPLGPRRGVLAVADGAGGMPGGAGASETAIRALAEGLAAVKPGEPLRPVILDGFERANRAILDKGSGSATTLVVVEVEDGVMRTYHAGDSGALVTGQRGKVKLQTTAHSPVGFGVEAGLLDRREALHHDELHVVSNLLGCPEMRIELGPSTPLSSRDVLLLASDGLLDNLHQNEIVERARKGDLGRAARQLARHCRRRMLDPRPQDPSKPDDTSFILFRPAG